MSLHQILESEQQPKVIELLTEDKARLYRAEFLEMYVGLVREEVADLKAADVPTLMDYNEMEKNVAFTFDQFKDAIYGYWIGNELVGMGGVVREDKRMINVYVKPRFRRRGYAREIVELILEKETIVDLTVIPSNPIVKLYESLGFKVSLVTMFNTNK